MYSFNSFAEIQFQACSGYDDTIGLSLQASDCKSINEYGILGNVYLTNTSKYSYMTFGEGSVSDFEEWLNFRVSHNDDEMIEWLKNKNYVEYITGNFTFKSDE